MQEEETCYQTGGAKGRLRENWPWETPGSRPTLPHLRPKGGHRESFQDLDAQQIEAGIWGTLRSPQPAGALATSTQRFLPGQSPHYNRTSPAPRESPGQAPRGGQGAPTPQGGAKVSYPLAPRGPLSEREQEGELFQGAALGQGPSLPPQPLSAQAPSFHSAPAHCHLNQASGHHWQRCFSGCREPSALMLGGWKRHSERGVSDNR